MAIQPCLRDNFHTQGQGELNQDKTMPYLIIIMMTMIMIMMIMMMMI